MIRPSRAQHKWDEKRAVARAAGPSETLAAPASSNEQVRLNRNSLFGLVLLAVALVAIGAVAYVRLWRIASLSAPRLPMSSGARTVAIQDASDPQRGRLSGIVLDERAQAAPGVTVQAGNTGYPIQGALPSTQTDAEGHFALAGLLPGHTYVNAFKEAAFYPNASSNFWDGEGLAWVEVPVGGEVSEIVLKLKPAGRLQVKTMKAATRAVIDQFVVVLERDGEPNRGMGGGRLGDWWLVPTVPIRLCVTAAGFQAAWYGGDGTFERSVPITLAPRQILTARVSLRLLNRAAPEKDATCSSRRSR